MIKLYDEKVYREVSPPPGAPDDNTRCDVYNLRVRLFRSDIRDAKLLGADTWTVYLLCEEYKSFEGPIDKGLIKPKEHSRTRTYVRGPDSERIRQAISVLDGFIAPTKEAK